MVVDLSKGDLVGGKGGEQVCRECGMSASTMGKIKPLCSECYQTNTIRDQFAMAALSGITARTAGGNQQETASLAYEYADAMMQERKK